jgi:SAM-dependent methyltransferase
MTIAADGWHRHNIWEQSQTVRELYRARCRDEAEEMTCAAQAAELLASMVRPGESLLDVGCGSGYFWHSLRKRGIEVEYWGVDASDALLEIGREELPVHGLPAERLRTIRLEDLDGSVDHVVCMNVLSNIDNYHRPLERLLGMARRSLILRESLGQGSSYTYVRDEFLDPGVDLRVHVNRYDQREVMAFVESYGFSVRHEVDRRTNGKPELVIGHPHHWTFLVARRVERERVAG